MSELLDESRQRKDKAIEDKKTCGNGLSYGLFKGKEMAWQEAIDLIEKHEKPKGLLQYVRPPYYREFPPLEFSTNFWNLKYRVLDYVQLGKDVKEARVGIEEEFEKFHFANFDFELTDKQQEIYDDLKSYYEASMADDPKYALSLALGDYGHNDNLNKNSDLLPVLKKFLSEVERND